MQRNLWISTKICMNFHSKALHNMMIPKPELESREMQTEDLGETDLEVTESTPKPSRSPSPTKSVREQALFYCSDKGVRSN